MAPLRKGILGWITFLLLYVFLFGSITTTTAQTVIPSYSVETCTSNSNTNCVKKLYAIVYFNNVGSDFEISFQLTPGTQIVGTDGRPWELDSPVSLKFKRWDTRIVYALDKRTTIKNAYEKVTTTSQLTSCPSSSLCCNMGNSITQVRQFAQNDTKYDVYDVRTPAVRYTVTITVQQGANTLLLNLGPTAPSATIPGITASITSDYVEQSNFKSFSGLQVVAQESAALQDLFLVENFFFAPLLGTGYLGMDASNYLSTTTCATPIGKGFRVNNGDIYDQFSTFRSRKVSTNNPCNFYPERSSLASGDSALSFQCDNIGTLALSLELDATFIKLTKLFGEPQVTDSGMFPFQISDTDAVIYIDITNKGTHEGTFELRPLACCLNSGNPPDCSSIVIQSAIAKYVAPFATERFKFAIRSSVLISKNGYCSFDVYQQGVREFSTRVDFDTSGYLEGTPIDGNTASCDPPNIIIVKNNRRYCREPCTIDQQFNSTLQACVQVNCQEKYFGFKSFYNVQTGLCEPTAECFSWTETYDPVNNNCVPINTGGGAGGGSNSTTGGGNGDGGSGNEGGNSGGGNSGGSPGNNNGGGGTSSPPIDDYTETTSTEELLRNLTNAIKGPECGEHGKLTASGTSCVCDYGWVTIVGTTVLWCSQLVNTTSSGSGSGGGGGGPGTVFGSNFITIVAGSGAGIVALFLACCIPCCAICCVRRRREQRYKRELLQRVKQLSDNAAKDKKRRSIMASSSSNKDEEGDGEYEFRIPDEYALDPYKKPARKPARKPSAALPPPPPPHVPPKKFELKSLPTPTPTSTNSNNTGAAAAAAAAASPRPADVARPSAPPLHHDDIELGIGGSNITRQPSSPIRLRPPPPPPHSKQASKKKTPGNSNNNNSSISKPDNNNNNNNKKGLPEESNANANTNPARMRMKQAKPDKKPKGGLLAMVE